MLAPMNLIIPLNVANKCGKYTGYCHLCTKIAHLSTNGWEGTWFVSICFQDGISTPFVAGGCIRGKPAMMVSSSASRLPGPVKCNEKAYYQCAICTTLLRRKKPHLRHTHLSCFCNVIGSYSTCCTHNGHLKPFMDTDHVMDNTWQCTSQNPELMFITTLISKTTVYHGICNIAVRLDLV